MGLRLETCRGMLWMLTIQTILLYSGSQTMGLLISCRRDAVGSVGADNFEILVHRQFLLQGMLWALTCMKIHYGDNMKIPHLAGEPFSSKNASLYEPTFNNYLPYELVTLGAISFCLFLVNFGCIFAAAMVVLKVSKHEK